VVRDKERNEDTGEGLTIGYSQRFYSPDIAALVILSSSAAEREPGFLVPITQYGLYLLLLSEHSVLPLLNGLL